MTKIPVFDAAREFEACGPELLAAAERVLRSGRYILGPEVESFEQELAAHLGLPHVVGCASGTDALVLALRACGIGPGDRVITSAFSFFASAGAVVMVGAEPVLVDIEPSTFNLDPAAVAAVLGGTSPDHRGLDVSTVKALLPVHLFGQCADMGALTALAEEHGLALVEDAAQAVGSTYEGRVAGGFGLAGCLSFFPTKNLGGYGDGGAVVTTDESLAQRVKLLRAHGSSQKYVHDTLGTNSRLDPLQAALLRVRLGRLDGDNARRRRLAAAYSQALAGLAGVVVPPVAPGREHTWHQYTVRVPRRDEVRARMAAAGVETAVHYPRPLHHQPALSGLPYPPDAFPAAIEAARTVLSLPMFPTLGDDEVAFVAGCLADAVSDGSGAEEAGEDG